MLDMTFCSLWENHIPLKIVSFGISQSASDDLKENFVAYTLERARRLDIVWIEVYIHN